MRSAIKEFYPEIKNIVLNDYRVRIGTTEAGTNAKVHLDLGELGDFKAQIYLPVEAVFSPNDAPVEEGVAYVWRVDPESMAISRQRVSVGPILPYGIQIKEGLAPGDRVVGSGVHFLTDGTVVRELIREQGL